MGYQTLIYIKSSQPVIRPWLSISHYPLPKFCTPHQVPLSLDLHSAPGNNNPWTALCFRLLPLVLGIEWDVQLTNDGGDCYNALNMAHYTHKTRNFPSRIPHIYDWDLFQRRTTALAAVLAGKLHSRHPQVKTQIIQWIWAVVGLLKLCQPTTLRTFNPT